MDDAWELKRRGCRSMLSHLSLCLPVAFAALVAPAFAQESGGAFVCVVYAVSDQPGND